MDEVADNSVHLIVTSPPYWQLKDYGEDAQIGYNDSYQDYINHLGLAWAECRRTLENGCRLCVNIGDQFARAAYYGRYKVIPIKIEVVKCCEALGMDYMGTIIWQKTTTANPSGGGAVMGSYPYPRNGVVKIDHESILLFKKTGAPPRRAIDKRLKERSKLTAAEWNTYFSGHWNFPGARQRGHVAMFPPELSNRLIKMFSFAGDVVMDPFLGSGTTSLSAMNLGRHSVGYEINGGYENIIRQKLRAAESASMADAEFMRARAVPGEDELREKIASLPYVFYDGAPMKRRADPKKFHFGSKLDGEGGGSRRENFYRVRAVVGPDKLLLGNGATIRLLGIAPLKQKAAAATAMLREKTRGRTVFLRSDRERRDPEGNPLCYLYLANKTFLNAHLIKAGVAAADRTAAHRHLNKFIKYQEECNG